MLSGLHCIFIAIEHMDACVHSCWYRISFVFVSKYTNVNDENGMKRNSLKHPQNTVKHGYATVINAA